MKERKSERQGEFIYPGEVPCTGSIGQGKLGDVRGCEPIIDSGGCKVVRFYSLMLEDGSLVLFVVRKYVTERVRMNDGSKHE